MPQNKFILSLLASFSLVILLTPLQAEAYLEYHEAMARVFRERVEEGRSELDKIVDSSIKEYQTGDAKQ